MRIWLRRRLCHDKSAPDKENKLMSTDRDERLLPAFVDEQIPSPEDLLFLAIHQRRVIGIRHGIAH